MAKAETPKKPRWYRTIVDAFVFVRKNDSVFLPLVITVVALILATGVTLGFVFGGFTGHFYSNILAVALASLSVMSILAVRIDRAAYSVMEGNFGMSVRAVQFIRRGWKFPDEPIEVDGKGRAVVFYGVGKGGIALIAEGGGAARKITPNARRRIQRIVPGVPIHEIYVGNGHGEVPIRKLAKTVKGLKKELTRREREAVSARLKAIGAARLPIPKGMDPMRMRPSRRALRG